MREDNSTISETVGVDANGWKKAFPSKSAGCGTDCSCGSSADCLKLEAVCSIVIGDAIGGPSFSTVIVVC